MPEPVPSLHAIAFEETAPSTAPHPITTISSPESFAASSNDDKTPLDTDDPTSHQKIDLMHAPNGNGLKNDEQSQSIQDSLAIPASAEDQSLTPLSNIPSIKVDDASSRPSSRWSERRWGVLKPRKSTESVRPKSANAPSISDQPSFEGITMNIPTTDFQDLTPSSMEFSKRGSLVTAKPATPAISLPNSDPGPSSSPRKRLSNALRVRQSVLTSRAVSADEDMLSRRVRLMYEKGEDSVTDADVSRAIAEENGILWEEPTPVEGSSDQFSELNGSTTDFRSIASVGATSSIKRESKELAGGIEDWQNVDAADVDRYGFIVPRSKGGDSAEPQPIQRVSTSLLLASESPRRKNTFRRSAATVRSSSRSLASKSPTRDRKLSDSSTNRPSSSQSAYSPTLKRSPSKFRYATNRLPHNRDRRVRDEAGDMLTLPFEVPEAVTEDTLV